VSPSPALKITRLKATGLSPSVAFAAMFTLQPYIGPSAIGSRAPRLTTIARIDPQPLSVHPKNASLPLAIPVQSGRTLQGSRPLPGLLGSSSGQSASAVHVIVLVRRHELFVATGVSSSKVMSFCAPATAAPSLFSDTVIVT
jgi:hypothetical protein